MAEWRPHSFEATFPLDSGEISRRTLRYTLGNPLIWIPPAGYLCALAAEWFALFSLVGIGGALFVGLTWRWWWPRCAKLAATKVEQELVRESNRRQNDYLRAHISRLRRRGATHGAEILSRLLEAKRRFEMGISREGTHHSTLEKMERFGDTICHGVSKEVDALIEMERRLAGVLLERDESPLRAHEFSRSRCLEKIREGYSTLDEGARLVSESHDAEPSAGEGRVTGTGGPEKARRNDVDTGSLILSIEGLREELEVTRGVRNRLAPHPLVVEG